MVNVYVIYIVDDEDFHITNFLYFNDNSILNIHLKKFDFFNQLKYENGTLIPYLTGSNILNSKKL